MGNESSSLSRTPSDTPNSDMLSNYSLSSVRPGDLNPSGPHSPLAPPVPDLSHLTDEEIAQITAVVNRAKGIQHDEESRVRELEEEYLEFAQDIMRKKSLIDAELQTGEMCPICHDVPITTNPDELGQHECVDCEKVVCKTCSEEYNVLGTQVTYS